MISSFNAEFIDSTWSKSMYNSYGSFYNGIFLSVLLFSFSCFIILCYDFLAITSYCTTNDLPLWMLKFASIFSLLFCGIICVPDLTVVFFGCSLSMTVWFFASLFSLCVLNKLNILESVPFFFSDCCFCCSWCCC